MLLGLFDYLNSRRKQSRAEQSRAHQSRAEQSRAEQSRAEHGRNSFSYVLKLTLRLLLAMSWIALDGSLWRRDQEMISRGQDLTRAEVDQQQNQAEKEEDEPGEDEMQIEEAKADDEGVEVQEERSNLGWLQPGWLGGGNREVLKPMTKKMPRARATQSSENLVVSSESESVQDAITSRTSRREGIPCRLWQRGRCGYPDCRYSHANSGALRRERSPCRHWERGRCMFSDCKFSHANAGGYANSVRSRSRRRHR